MERAPALKAAGDCLQAALDFLQEHNGDDAVAQCRLKIRQSQWWLDRARKKTPKKDAVEMDLLEYEKSL